MPRPHPPDRRRAVELTNQRDENGDRLQPVATTAEKLGLSDSCLRNWMAQTAGRLGPARRVTSAERKELVELRRRTRVLDAESEA